MTKCPQRISLVSTPERDVTFLYKDGNNTARPLHGIRKPIYVRQISTMQFKKCISKGYKIYAIQVTNML